MRYSTGRKALVTIMILAFIGQVLVVAALPCPMTDAGAASHITVVDKRVLNKSFVNHAFNDEVPGDPHWQHDQHSDKGNAAQPCCDDEACPVMASLPLVLFTDSLTQSRADRPVVLPDLYSLAYLSVDPSSVYRPPISR